MKNKFISLALAALMLFAAACGGQTQPSGQSTDAQNASAAENASQTQAPETTEETASVTEEETTTAAFESTEETELVRAELRIGGLKGPTTIGLAAMMNNADLPYTYEVAAAADEILPKLLQGELDIALVPANAAAALWNRSGGKVTVIDINTLGVLYGVTGDETITSVKDLAGKTVLTTGQGNTPEYALRYLLKENGVEDCTLEFFSEATEVAARLAEDPTAIAVLPQPFVTVAEAQNEALHTAFSLTEEWDALGNGSRMLTGVTIARTALVQEDPLAIEAFLADHAASVESVLTDVDAAAAKVVELGIVPKEPIAKKAIPECNIVCITGDEMKEALSGYLQVLFDAAPEAVGGALPDETFYYIPY